MKDQLLPPLGWNSWDCFGTSVTEQEVCANAEFMARNLLPFGWNTVVIDIQWSEPNAQAGGYRPFAPLVMDDFGRLLPAPNRFPSAADGRGLKPLADVVHALHLRFGIHVMRGIPRQAVEQNLPIWNSPYTARDAANTEDTCPWNTDMFGLNMAHPAAQAYYDSILALYAAWEVDFIKADDMLYPYHADEIAGFRQAMLTCGRDMILSLSPGMALTTDRAPHMTEHAEMWRISPDFWDSWQDLKYQFDLCRDWSPFTRDGAYPDADMLPLGHISLRGERGEDRQSRFTRDEVITMLTLWSIFRSPLMLGCDLPTTDDETIALLCNPEVLEVNQHSQNNRELLRHGDEIVWTADSVDGHAQFFALFNTGEHELTVSVDLPAKGHVRDLWARRELDTRSGSLQASLPAHGAALYRVTREQFTTD
jgi:hypothetical protein